MQLSQKKNFSQFFSALLKCRWKFLNISKKRMTLLVNVFPKLPSCKDAVRQISKKSRFPVPFHKHRGKLAQKLFKSVQQHLYHIDLSVWRIFSLMKLLLVICKILRLFVNRFTADDKYSLLNRDNLMEPIQMQLSEKL